MIVRYADGTADEAILLSRSGNGMRVAIRGNDDVAEFIGHNGAWVTEDCEPVTIEFEWQRRPRVQPVTEADCICPRELAARLVHLLFSGTGEEAPAVRHHTGRFPEFRSRRVV